MNTLEYLIIMSAIVLCIIVIIIMGLQLKKGKYSYLRIVTISQGCIGFIAGITLVVMLWITPEPLVTVVESLIMIVIFTLLGLGSGFGHSKGREVVQAEIKSWKRK